MVPFIHSAREVHGVASPHQLRERHLAHLDAFRQRGMRMAPHVDRSPRIARINHNRWIVDCVCGAGVAVDPAWGFGCCFGCGAVYEHIVFPADRLDLEALLLARPVPATRNWSSGETVLDLALENVQKGVQF